MGDASFRDRHKKEAPASQRGHFRDETMGEALVSLQTGAGYPLMLNYYTLESTRGASVSGHRRTHRILYNGAGVALRRPSATAIKRYSAKKGSTFDVCVSASFPGGTVIGTVRVTHNGAGLWSMSGNGITLEQAAYVCEGVPAVLEARRPSMSHNEAGDLLVRRRARLAAG